MTKQTGVEKKARWGIVLSAAIGDLEEWSRHLKYPFDPWILKRKKNDSGSEYVLCSDRLNPLENNLEAKSAYQTLVSLLNSIMSFQRCAEPVSTSGEIIEFRDDGSEGRHVFIEVAPATIRIKGGQVLITITSPDGKVIEPEPFESMIQSECNRALNSDDDYLFDIYRFLDEDDGWIGLYKVYEILKASLGGPSHVAKILGVSKNEQERFRRTCEMYRHARFNPPDHPFEVGEARTMIYRMAKAWIHYERSN